MVADQYAGFWQWNKEKGIFSSTNHDKLLDKNPTQIYEILNHVSVPDTKDNIIQALKNALKKNYKDEAIQNFPIDLIEIIFVFTYRNGGNYQIVLSNAFLSGARHLEQIIFPDLSNLNFIRGRFLFKAENLKQITFGDLSKLESIGDDFLCDAKNLKKIYCPESAVEIIKAHLPKKVKFNPVNTALILPVAVRWAVCF